MSLILDALRKLEREKTARDPGVLVVGSVPWGGRSRTRRLALGAGGVALLAFAVLVGWLLRPPVPPAVAARPAAVLPTPETRPTATPAPPLPAPVATGARTEPARTPAVRLSPPLPTATNTATPRTSARVQGAHDAPSPTTPPPVAASTAGTDAARSSGPAAHLRLNAISQRDGRPVALINDRLVFEGDSFDGVRVLHIRDAEVELEVGGQRRVLRF